MTHSYEERLIRVLDHIHDNPAGDLSLDALADVAAMSRFHWHRVFRAMTGETLAQAVRRVRLHRAACWLVQTDLPVARIGRQVGYPNLHSFTRSFDQAYGLGPAAFRQRGDLRAPLRPNPKGDPQMFDVTLEHRPDCRLAGLPHSGPYPEISRAFSQVFALIAARGDMPRVRGMVAAYFDDPESTPADQLRSFAAAVVGADYDAAPPLQTMTLPGGDHGVLLFKGPYTGLPAAYDHLYGTWLPASERQAAASPSFEVYLNSPQDTAPDDLLTEICLPLAPA